VSEEGARHRAHPARRQRLEAVGYFVAFLVGGLTVAHLNHAHIEQQVNFVSEYVRMANYYRGLDTKPVLTYPMWGYPLVLLAMPDYDVVAVAQVVLASFVATLLLLALQKEMPGRGPLLAGLFVVAGPWYALHSVKWPQSFAASLCVLGVLVLARAFRRTGLALGAAAGLVFGAALYFRSEFLYLPLFMVCVAIATHGLRRAPILPAVTAAVVAWAALTPWAIHYHRLTGHYSLTASQRGIVAFISLGQLPGNPWDATYLDEYAYDYLKQQGINEIPQSDSGDRVLYDEFKRRVREHPAAFVKKMAWNGVMTLAGGFYNGEIALTSGENEQLVALRSGLRAAIGSAETTPASRGQRPGARVYAALVYWAAAKAAGALFVTVAIAGLLVALWRGIKSPLLLLLAAYVAYQILLMVALATEPRYLNGLYLALVPFFIVACSAASDAWRRWRSDLDPSAAIAA
jgi:hypothetical protein